MFYFECEKVFFYTLEEKNSYFILTLTKFRNNISMIHKY